MAVDLIEAPLSMPLIRTIIRPFCHALLSIICLFACTLLVLRSANILGFAGVLGVSTVCWIVLLSARRYLFWGLALPLLLGAALYLPTSLMYGFPSEDIVSALFYSNPGEASGYLSVIGAKEYAYAFTLLGCAVVFGLSYQRYAKPIKTRLAGIALLILALLLALPSSRQTIWDQAYPFSFVQAFSKIYHSFNSQDYATNGLSDWQVSASHPKYQDYVLIIGESARKDYLSAFGYPQDTSPFMRQAKGLLLDGLISPGDATVSSLTRMLTLTGQGHEANEQINYRYNFIDLAKKAGFRTYWLSSQGKYGGSESPVSILGQKSDYSHFAKIKGGDFKGPSDWALLPQFDAVLTAPERPAQRLIILHLFGSHFNACDRIDQPNPAFKHSRGRPYECYLSSLEQTDQLLAKVYASLQQNQAQTGRSFSMLYFSDHGQGQHTEAIRHDKQVKQGYEVPLFRLNSDDTQQQYVKAAKSGFNMLFGLANWMGISEPNIPAQYDLFSAQADQNILVKGTPPIPYEALRDDPALLK